MATRCQFENSHEIGVFSALTNSYCLAGTSFVQSVTGFSHFSYVSPPLIQKFLFPFSGTLTALYRYWRIGKFLFRVGSGIT
jgi:hypothetical protein